MSTDAASPEPGDTDLAGRTPEAPAEPEPFLAELAGPEEPPPPRRRRLVRRPQPPRPPHPTFCWAIGWCFLMLIVTQLMPAFVISVVVIGGEMVLESARHGAGGGLGQMSQQDLQHMIILPTVLASQVTLIAFSLLVLRLAVGRDWHRQVGLRLPAVKHVVLALVLWPALTLSASGVYQAARMLPGLNHILSYFVTVCGVLAVIGLAWILVRGTTGRDWVKELAARPARVQLVLAPLGCLAAAGVGALIFHQVDPYLPTFDLLNTSSLMEDMVKEFRTWPPATAVLIIGLGPGLGEELWCRAFLGRGLVGRHGVVMGVILTSLFFGAIHVDPHQGTMAAIMGLALHFSYLMTRSLCVPMLLHFLNNSLSVIADKLPQDARERLQNIDTSPEAIPWQVLAASACLLLAAGWALYASRARLERVDGSSEPPWQPPFAGVAHPPPGSGTAVVYPWPGLLPTLAVIAALAGFGCALYWA
jgi:membrane protease YdiL (CAAX protease family)